MRVWIDQDLCTGDGLCTDHCPEMFTMLDDGLSYVHDQDLIGNDPGGYASALRVPQRHEQQVVLAAVDCPGECIFVEVDVPAESERTDDNDIFDAVIVET